MLEHVPVFKQFTDTQSAFFPPKIDIWEIIYFLFLLHETKHVFLPLNDSTIIVIFVISSSGHLVWNTRLDG